MLVFNTFLARSSGAIQSSYISVTDIWYCALLRKAIFLQLGHSQDFEYFKN